MSEQKIREMAQVIIETSAFVHLGTLDARGYPHIRLMFNFLCAKICAKQQQVIKGYHEGFITYLGTNTSSEKLSHIQKNPQASLYYEITDSKWQGLLLLGELEIVNDMKIKNTLWEDAWVRYYPKGVTDPDFTILRFKPYHLKLYAGMAILQLELGKGKQ